MTKRKQNSLFITLDDLVSEDHPYRKLDALLSFDELANPFLDIYSAKGRKEKGVSFGLRTLVLQFIEVSVIERWNAFYAKTIQQNGSVN